ncbi:MAG: TonB-dependent receptor [Flavobacterium sp.]|nr:MAG: TonB-dependent receptor [Flavobacterium sp.]
MKKLFFLWLLLPAISLAQSIRFEGFVVDAASKPLEMANVMAVNSATKSMDSYAITNDKGRFVLSLKANTAYTIKFSFLGMQTKEISVTTETANMTRTVTLEEGGIELQGVEIVREMPVSISGDTIVYNADSFKSGTERKLEDVLKKLPGVEVNADGEVEVEGKKVSKLMVEGKDFFDGDTKLGVKNIPADAIDKVQVLRNYNDISALKGVENNTENVAMNIKLKEGKKNFWFGDLDAGIGIADDETRYVANPKVFYYSPKYSLNVIGNSNNIGELPFTVQDYFKFTGGFRSMMQKGGTNFNISSNDLGISLLRNNRAKEIETQFGAANFSYNVTKAWSLSGFAIGSSTITDIETRTQTVRLPNELDPGASENREDQTHQKSNLGLFKLSSSYKPDASLQFDYDALLKISGQDETGVLSSVTTSAEGVQNQSIFTDKNQTPLSLNQNLSVYFTKNDKNVFAVEMQHLYNEEDPFYNPNLGVNPFPDSLIFPEANIGITPQERYDLNQKRFVTTNKLDSKLDYYYMLTPKSNVNVTFGNTYSYQRFNSSVFQLLDNGSIHYLNPNTVNNVTYKFDDAFVGLHYKFITGKFTFNPGFSVHGYNTYNDQGGDRTENNFFRVLPDVYALWQMKKSESLTYNYAITTDFTDINRFAEGYTFSDYNSLFRGNRKLESALMQTHSLRYFKYNMFNFTNIFAFVNYTKRVDAVKTKSFFAGNNQVSTSTNIDSNFADESISGAANYGRSFLKYYKASLMVNLNWSKFNNIIGVPDLDANPDNNAEFVQTTESFTQSYTLKASTNYHDFPNIEAGYNVAINDYSGRKFYTEKPFAKLDYYFLDAFSFVAEYEFYHYTSSDDSTNNEYDFLTASLIYQKKDSKWEYKVSGTNLMNTTSLNDDSFNQFRTSTSQYIVQPRYLIFSIKYNI